MYTATEIVGMRVKSFRTKRKLSQEKLAELSNLHTTYIGQIERGEKNPSLLSLIKIANALEISPETLISKLGVYDEENSGIPNKAYNLFMEVQEEDAEKLFNILVEIVKYKYK